MDNIEVLIIIPKNYYEILKHEVEVNHWDFLPCTLIAKGVLLPKEHGRLIDADALIKDGCYWETMRDLSSAPTIIKAR